MHLEKFLKVFLPIFVAVVIVLCWVRPHRCMRASKVNTSKYVLCPIRITMCALLLSLLVCCILALVDERIFEGRMTSSFGFYY